MLVFVVGGGVTKKPSTNTIYIHKILYIERAVAAAAVVAVEQKGEGERKTIEIKHT